VHAESRDYWLVKLRESSGLVNIQVAFLSCPLIFIGRKTKLCIW
jgi:hypothetical protein